jgi:hypothetical protein
MIRSRVTTMSLPTGTLQCQRSKYVTRVTHYTTIHIRVTWLAPYVPQHNHAPKIIRSIVIQATGSSSVKCFQTHLSLNVNGKAACQWRQVRRNYSIVITSESKHECFKRFLITVTKSNLQVIFATWLHSSLANFPTFMYVFSDTECTQDLEGHEGSFEHTETYMCSANMLEV